MLKRLFVEACIVAVLVTATGCGEGEGGLSSLRHAWTAEARATIEGYASRPEIEWVRIDANTIYLGVTHCDRDIEETARELALRGNEQLNFGCHVWVVPAGSPRYGPDLISNSYFNVTARYGRIVIF